MCGQRAYGGTSFLLLPVQTFMFKLETEIVNCWQACNDHSHTTKKTKVKRHTGFY
jgi:hypothetical protein